MHYASYVVEIVTGLMALLLIAAVVLSMSKRIKLPFTVVLVLVGISLSMLTDYSPFLFSLLHEIEITPDVFLFIFLPTLLFESAFNLDVKLLRQNLTPVLMMAIPGVLISTLIIGFIIAWATSLPLPAALLLGAILSATDPVAVVAIFRKLGAPKRLTTLVEGESLFNDASAIVLARLLAGILIAGAFTFDTAIQGAVDIVVLFTGGFITGWLMGLFSAYLLGKVESDPFIEITLTTVVAYASFLFAEEVLHVSGVMATVGAGLVLGSWGRIKISSSVRIYLEHFWEYMAFVANALIFLMVGLKVDLSALWNSLDLLVWVIFAMLVSRAVIVYGLMSLIGRLPSAEYVNNSYKNVIFWGGMRGAVGIAIVFSLPEFEYTETFTVLVIGAVLFTLIVQGLTMQPLVKWLGLARKSAADQLTKIEVSLDGKLEAKERVSALADSGIFSNKVTYRLQTECENQIKELKKNFKNIRNNQLSHDMELKFLYLRVLVEEKSKYVEMFNKGYIGEAVFREQFVTVSMQIDAIRSDENFEHIRIDTISASFERFIIRLIKNITLFSHWKESLQLNQIARIYERLWAQYNGSNHVIKCLDHFTEIKIIRSEVLDIVREKYRNWHQQTAEQLDNFSERYPEFILATQERMCRRLAYSTEDEYTQLKFMYGTLPDDLANEIHAGYLEKIRLLRGLEVAKLQVDPEQLLQDIVFFKDLDEEEVKYLAQNMIHGVYSRDDNIIQQGSNNESLFIVARGVVRITAVDEQGHQRNLATLLAGDVFGELTFLHKRAHTKSAYAVTSCTLYELKRDHLLPVIKKHPEIADALLSNNKRNYTSE